MTGRVITLYKKVQGIPYHCLENRDPGMLLERNRGSCSEKHIFLGKEFERMGIPVRYVLIRFDWNDLPVPQEIIRKKDSPVGWHLALRIKLKDRWLYVDATWDPGLEAAGFPVTRDWDGKSDTRFAFPPREIIELDEKPDEQTERKDNREFYDSLNAWMESKREMSA